MFTMNHLSVKRFPFLPRNILRTYILIIGLSRTENFVPYSFFLKLSIIVFPQSCQSDLFSYFITFMKKESNIQYQEAMRSCHNKVWECMQNTLQYIGIHNAMQCIKRTLTCPIPSCHTHSALSWSYHSPYRNENNVGLSAAFSACFAEDFVLTKAEIKKLL